MTVQAAEVAAQLVGVEIRIAGPVRRQQALGHPPLEVPRQVPGHLVLIQLVAARRQVEVIPRQGAQLRPHEQSPGAAFPLARLRADAAWPGGPSAPAGVAAAAAGWLAAPAEKRRVWLRRRKSSTPRAEGKRALPQVGGTWLGPAT